MSSFIPQMWLIWIGRNGPHTLLQLKQQISYTYLQCQAWSLEMVWILLEFFSSDFGSNFQKYIIFQCILEHSNQNIQLKMALYLPSFVHVHFNQDEREQLLSMRNLRNSYYLWLSIII